MVGPAERKHRFSSFVNGFSFIELIVLSVLQFALVCVIVSLNGKMLVSCRRSSERSEASKGRKREGMYFAIFRDDGNNCLKNILLCGR